jgi:hypothetical protein
MRQFSQREGRIAAHQPGCFELDYNFWSIRAGARFGHDPQYFVRAFVEIVIDELIVELASGRHLLRCRLLPHFELLLRVSAAFAYPPSQLGIGWRRDKDGYRAWYETFDRAGPLNVCAEKNITPICQRFTDGRTRDAFVLAVDERVFKQLAFAKQSLELLLRHEMVVDAFLFTGARRPRREVYYDEHRRVTRFELG